MSGIVVRHPNRVHFGDRLRDVQIPAGLPSLEALRDELHGYCSVLLGREPAPISAGISTLLEVADAYFARACEIDMLIHEAEATGEVLRGSPYYKYRTGELRAFLDMSKKAAETGSRRVTVAQLEYAQQRDAGLLG